jgi:hypothetical protein
VDRSRRLPAGGRPTRQAGTESALAGIGQRRRDDLFTLFNLGWTLLDLARTEEGLPRLERRLEKSAADTILGACDVDLGSSGDLLRSADLAADLAEGLVGAGAQRRDSH